MYFLISLKPYVVARCIIANILSYFSGQLAVTDSREPALFLVGGVDFSPELCVVVVPNFGTVRKGH